MIFTMFRYVSRNTTTTTTTTTPRPTRRPPTLRPRNINRISNEIDTYVPQEIRQRQENTHRRHESHR